MKKIVLSSLVSLSLVLTACSTGDKMMKHGEDKMNHDKMSDHKMSDKMKDDKMKDDKMKDDKMKDDKMKDDKMKDDKMKDKDKKMDENEKKNEGELATDFTLDDIEGKSFQLSKQKGKKVYIKFWASWCPICLASLPELNEQAKEKNDYEIVTVVSPGHLGEKKKEDFIEWFKSLKYNNIRVLLDEKGEFIKNYNVKATPTNVLVGSDGVLIKVFPGQLKNKESLDKIYAQIK